MRIPTIFKGKTCSCGSKIEDECVKEVGIDLNSEQYVLRFNCPECGLNGRLLFKAGSETGNPFEEMFKMADADRSNRKSRKSEAKKPTKEELFCANFDQNKIGCLFIPEWTDEYVIEFERTLNADEKD